MAVKAKINLFIYKVVLGGIYLPPPRDLVDDELVRGAEEDLTVEEDLTDGVEDR